MAPFKYFYRNSITLFAILLPISVSLFWKYGALSAIVITSFLLVFPTIASTFLNRNAKAKALVEITGEESKVLGFGQDRFNLIGALERNGKSGPLLEQQAGKGINSFGGPRRNDKPGPLLEQQAEKGINSFGVPRRNDKPGHSLEQQSEKGINNLCESLRRNDKSGPVIDRQPENAINNICQSVRGNDETGPGFDQQPENAINNICQSVRRNDKPEPLVEQQFEKGIIAEEFIWLNAGGIVADQKNANGEDQFQEQMVKSPEELFSESESNDLQFSSEDSDVDWICSGQSPDCSDESISDEESLIEIEIPSLNYDVEDPKLFFQYKKPQDHFLGLRQQSLMDNEMNEEDNLIEIDISIGSIKCSRFEI